jgi:hypothetical protein
MKGCHFWAFWTISSNTEVRISLYAKFVILNRIFQIFSGKILVYEKSET